MSRTYQDLADPSFISEFVGMPGRKSMLWLFVVLLTFATNCQKKDREEQIPPAVSTKASLNLAESIGDSNPKSTIVSSTDTIKKSDNADSPSETPQGNPDKSEEEAQTPGTVNSESAADPGPSETSAEGPTDKLGEVVKPGNAPLESPSETIEKCDSTSGATGFYLDDGSDPRPTQSDSEPMATGLSSAARKAATPKPISGPDIWPPYCKNLTIEPGCTIEKVSVYSCNAEWSPFKMHRYVGVVVTIKCPFQLPGNSNVYYRTFEQYITRTSGGSHPQDTDEFTECSKRPLGGCKSCRLISSSKSPQEADRLLQCVENGCRRNVPGSLTPIAGFCRPDKYQPIKWPDFLWFMDGKDASFLNGLCVIGDGTLLMLPHKDVRPCAIVSTDIEKGCEKANINYCAFRSGPFLSLSGCENCCEKLQGELFDQRPIEGLAYKEACLASCRKHFNRGSWSK